MRKYLTLDDLLLFCKKNNFNHFNAKEADGPIVVQTHGKFELSGDANIGLQPVKLVACHTSLNRNQSYISKSAMEAALPSFSNRPILGYIHQLEDGTWDFYSHNMEVVEDENEKDGTRIDYLETPVGIIPESCNAHLEYDEENNVYRTCVNGFIFEEYSKAGDILRAKGISNVSVELAINDMSYNSDEGYLSINDFYFMGVTILGRDEDGNIVEPGMAGSNITLGSFSAENNSMLNNDIQNTLIDTLNRLAESLEKFNNKTDPTKEGVNEKMDKLNELLEAYQLTSDEITFDVDGLSDEELEAAFTEAFGDVEEFKKKRCEKEESEDEDFAGCGKRKKCSEEESGEEPEEEDEDFAGCGKKKKCDADEEESVEDEPKDDFSGCGKKKRCSVNAEADTIEFELSHDDIRMALYTLIESEDDSWNWICEVYDNYFIYQHEFYNDSEWVYAYYKQGYSKSEDAVELSGDPVEVFPAFVTESERTALDMIRSQYDELKKFHDETIAAQQKVQKDKIFANQAYDAIRGSEEFKTLMIEADKYPVEELQNKCDLMFAASMKAQFAAKDQKPHTISFNFAKKEEKKKTYGNLFDK